MKKNIKSVLVFLISYLFFASAAQAIVNGTVSKIIDWADCCGNVQGRYDSGQAVCDARARLLGINFPLHYVKNWDGGGDTLEGGACLRDVSKNWDAWGFPNKYQSCPPNTLNTSTSNNFCIWTCPNDQLYIDGQCQANKANAPPTCRDSIYTRNPIHIATGNKHWLESDYLSALKGGAHFYRYYNSHNNGKSKTLGQAWRHNYNNFISTGNTVNGVAVVLVVRPDGRVYSFAANGNAYISQDADVADRLTAIFDANNSLAGWKYQIADDGSIETYDAEGKLLSISDRTSLALTLTYSDSTTPVTIAPKASLLIRVTDSFGRQLNFTYDSIGRINTMTDPAGGQYVYAYDASNNLASVTYPDLKVKTYRYNESAYTGDNNLANALTGIEDENGVRYASYWYDAQGRAYKEEHAGGVDRYQIAYSADGSNSTITDPLGTARTTNFNTILGVIKSTSQSQPGGSGCGPASSAITYDAHGNVASRTDFNGSKVCYAYDLARNLETARVEGLPASADCATALSASSLTSPARKITTQWHPQYRLPTLVAEPQRLKRHEHDANGNVLTRTVWATNDTTGASGAAAMPVGAPRTWAYTYNQYGQVLTATGSRTDVEDKTVYTYDDATGNLLTVINAAGHVTTYGNYDAHGRVGRIVDANGLTTDLEYTPRGWLKTRTVSGNGVNELTSYDYDGVGQLKKVSLPDGSWVGYTYDDAHRLTDIYDSAGNTIHYTLDAMGNRTQEEVKDPTGALARQTSRIYDALNRLQQVTGGLQ